MNYEAHQLLAAQTDVPVHIGITEAGTPHRGKLKSAIGIGSLLLSGIGDTMRVSLTADPVEEVFFAGEILRTLGLRASSIDLVSCPTCGRTRIDLEALAHAVEVRLAPLEEALRAKGHPSIKVAVMGLARSTDRARRWRRTSAWPGATARVCCLHMEKSSKRLCRRRRWRMNC